MKSKVSELLEKISRKSAQFSSGEVSKVEIDLLMQQLRELYDVLDDLRSGSVKEVMKPVETTPPVVEQVKIQEEVSPVIVYTEEKNTIEKVTKTVTEVTSTVVPPVQEQQAGPMPAAKSRASINEVVPPSETLNSKLKTAVVREVHHKLSVKPLREMLDLNLRHVLAKELFGNRNELFAQAIDQIDNAPDYDTAHTFIHTQLLTQHGWSEKTETTQLFIGLVKRKFGVE